jgi:toxin ParE1/3/4
VSDILPGPNRRYVVQPAANDDIEKVWYFTMMNWSVSRADRSIDELHSIFEILSLMPQMGRELKDIDSSLRTHTHGFHVIVYRVEEERINIVRVLGGRQDWLSILRQSEA